MPQPSTSNPGLEQDRGWLLELAVDLQRTLHIGDLIAIFSERVREVVPHDHLEYAAPDERDCVSVGAAQPFRCDYDVVSVSYTHLTLPTMIGV